MSERWTPFFFGEGKLNAVLDEQDRIVASVGSKERGGDESKDADADLIAAAPELLEACETAMTYFRNKGSATDPVFQKQAMAALEAAVAKARGEESDET